MIPLDGAAAGLLLLPLDDDNLRSAPERNLPLDFGCCGTYGSDSSDCFCVPSPAFPGFMGLFGPAVADDALALVCVSEVDIGAGAAEDEELNLELILDIHDDFVGVFSAELVRLRKLGRLPLDEDLEIGALGVLLLEELVAGFWLGGCAFSRGTSGGGVGFRGGVLAGVG